VKKKPPLAASKNARVLSRVHNSNIIPDPLGRGHWFSVFPPRSVSRPVTWIIRLINADRFKTVRCFYSTVVKFQAHIYCNRYIAYYSCIAHNIYYYTLYSILYTYRTYTVYTHNVFPVPFPDVPIDIKPHCRCVLFWFVVVFAFGWILEYYIVRSHSRWRSTRR